MADFETIRSVSGARASQIDEGLKAHMNKVYGTMSVGMIITALGMGHFRISNNDRPSSCCRPDAKRNNADWFGSDNLHVTFTLGYYACASCNDFRVWRSYAKIHSSSSTAVFLCLRYIDWRVSELNFYFLYNVLDYSNVLGNIDRLRRFIIVGIYDKERYFRLGFVSNNGGYRSNSRYNCKLLFAI